MFRPQQRRVATAVFPSFSSLPISRKPVLIQHEATCRACGRRVTEFGSRANFRMVSRDPQTGQFWTDRCPSCRLRPR